jgi:hypothetical protein
MREADYPEKNRVDSMPTTFPIIKLWRLSFLERIKILVSGQLWSSQLTLESSKITNSPKYSLKISVNKNTFIKYGDKNSINRFGKKIK